MNDWKNKRMAVYIRRSEGESGNTKKQLARIRKQLKELEKSGKIAKLNMNIVGRDIEKKRRFNAKNDLALQGDIYNEGDRQSGFKFEERPVFLELLRRMKEGQYDGIIVESMNRIARDFAGLSRLALPVWREDGKVILSLSDNQVLDDDRTNEAIINSQMTWGGIGKLGEIAKAETARLGDSVDKGYFKGSNPEFLGSGTKGAGLDYRRAYNLMKAYGENDRGNLNSPTAVGAEFKKDNKWASLWYKKLRGYDETGVLEDWLKSVEEINQFIRNIGGYPGNAYKSTAVKNILKSSTGFFAYPAGVNPAGTDEFVMFPVPIKVGLQELADNENPLEIESFEVKRTKLGSRKLHPIQTQPRSRK